MLKRLNTAEILFFENDFLLLSTYIPVLNLLPMQLSFDGTPSKNCCIWSFTFRAFEFVF